MSGVPEEEVVDLDTSDVGSSSVIDNNTVGDEGGIPPPDSSSNIGDNEEGEEEPPTKVQRTGIKIDGVSENKVFIGCIPQTVSDESLKKELRGKSEERKSEPRKILGLCYVRDGQQSDRGVAFVTFSTKEEADECVNEMNGNFVFKNANRPIHAKLTCEKLHGNLTGTVFDRNPDIYGKKLPHTHWTEYTADDTGLVYYNNDATGESVWEKPECLAEAEQDLPPEPSPTPDTTTTEEDGEVEGEEIKCD